MPTTLSLTPAAPEQLTTVPRRRKTDTNARENAGSSTRSLRRASYSTLFRLAEELVSRADHPRPIDLSTLVNEAARRSLGASGLQELTDRSDYVAFLANALRGVVADLIEAQQCQRGGITNLSLFIPGVAGSLHVLTLLAYLRRLNELSERHAQIAVLRIFGGMSDGEIAQQLGVTTGRAATSWRRVAEWFDKQRASVA